MRPYLAVLKARFSLLLQYRTAAFAGFVTQCWWGTIKVMVLTTFIASGRSPMSARQVVDYVWLTQALLTLLPWSGDPEIGRMVRSGDVAFERLRPLDTYAFWYARALARRTATPLLRAIPMVILTAFILPALGMAQWGLSAPAGLEGLLLFAVSLVVLVALSSAVATVIDLLIVLTLTDRGVNTLAGPFVVVLSGSLIPLPLFPDWLQRGLEWQPFAGLMDTPLRLYGGHLVGGAAAGALVRQALWAIILILLGRFMMGRVMARLQIQGG
jgi:ABC-2 type transport system permease protein